ncbi:MAG: hypothetical protein N2663_05475 [Chlorobi bacterium]|nr:hypothetical protein [Chlorobiota bacterium]
MKRNWFVALGAVAEQPIEFPPLADGMHLLHADDYHITVAFLGALRADPTDHLTSMLHSMHRAQLDAVADRALLLPQPTYASVVALGFSDVELTAFIAQWRNQLRAAVGLPPEERSVLPHMTVVRMKPSRDVHIIERRKQWVRLLAERLPWRFRLKWIGLYTWREHAHQSRYRMTLRIELN